MTRYYYCALLKKAVVFQHLDRKIDDSNISPKIISTMDLRNCLALLHELPAIKPFLSYAPHRRGIGR